MSSLFPRLSLGGGDHILEGRLSDGFAEAITGLRLPTLDAAERWSDHVFVLEFGSDINKTEPTNGLPENVVALRLGTETTADMSETERTEMERRAAAEVAARQNLRVIHAETEAQRLAA